MSRNILIQEGGTAKQLTADKLKTALAGGGSCLWVPESAVGLIEKRITENGTYAASGDGAYGYSVVTVNVPGAAGEAYGTGASAGSDSEAYSWGTPGGEGSAVLGQDEDGDDAITTVVGGTYGGTYGGSGGGSGSVSTGHALTVKVPSAIDIEIAPYKLSYTDGEMIDYDGMFVRLKLRTGGNFTDSAHPNGLLALSELGLPVTTASLEDIVPTTGGSGSGAGRGTYYTSAGSTVQVNNQGPNETNYVTVPSGVRFCGLSDNDAMYVFAASTSSFSVGYISVQNGVEYNESGTSGTCVYNGVTYHYRYGSWYAPTPTPTINTTPMTGNIVESGMAALFGSAASEVSTGTQTIPVTWTSTYDGRVFSDSFEITVFAEET